MVTVYRRLAVAMLTLSASAFIALVGGEGYTENAVVPVKGDVPTAGFGSTSHVDGSRVQMGDKLDPVRAVITAGAHLAKDEDALRKCMDGAEMSQAEWDIAVDFSYQYGVPTFCKSSMRRHILAGEYREACDAYLAYRFVAGYDCSTIGNKRCWGVWVRQVERNRKCLEAQ